MIDGSDLLSVDSHFAFGKNWLDYANKLDEARIAQAVADLQRLSGLDRFDGMSLLDIGCGSGLHSLAAVRMGATRVTGVDIDADSVEASRRTMATFAPSANAQFTRVSVFDMRPEEYGGFDLVYSWGVLHHTGDMYRALRAASGLVRPNGTLMLALYKRTPFCNMWRRLKRWYAQAPPPSQRRAMAAYVGVQRALFRIKGQDFEAHVLEYGQRRGMDYYNDVHDWLGGYPYQSITPSECRTFFSKLGFTLEREFIGPTGRFLPGLLGSSCDEYVFRKKALAAT